MVPGSGLAEHSSVGKGSSLTLYAVRRGVGSGAPVFRSRAHRAEASCHIRAIRGWQQLLLTSSPLAPRGARFEACVKRCVPVLVPAAANGQQQRRRTTSARPPKVNKGEGKMIADLAFGLYTQVTNLPGAGLKSPFV